MPEEQELFSEDEHDQEDVAPSNEIRKKLETGNSKGEVEKEPSLTLSAGVDAS